MNCIEYSSLVTRADTLTIIQVQLPIFIWICKNTKMWETFCVTLPLDFHKVFHMYFYLPRISQQLGCYIIYKLSHVVRFYTLFYTYK